jgi:hypothetical protein
MRGPFRRGGLAKHSAESFSILVGRFILRLRTLGGPTVGELATASIPRGRATR